MNVTLSARHYRVLDETPKCCGTCTWYCYPHCCYQEGQLYPVVPSGFCNTWEAHWTCTQKDTASC
ncbi:MAG: hypothetical protein V2A79_14820 [Planctomycetota bacterium]